MLKDSNIIKYIKMNDFKKVEKLIKKGKGISISDRYCWTPLHHFASFDKQKLARLIIEKGVDVNAINNQGRTPLHISIALGNVEIAVMLIESGADFNIIDKFGFSPLHLAICTKKCVDIALRLVREGADVNAVNSYGHTPLQLAKRADEQEIVDLLIEYGANPNVEEIDNMASYFEVDEDNMFKTLTDIMNETFNKNND